MQSGASAFDFQYSLQRMEMLVPQLGLSLHMAKSASQSPSRHARFHGSMTS